MGAICTQAGVTKGVFSHHFPGGKDELVADVVGTNGEQVRELLEQSAHAPGGRRSPSPRWKAASWLARAAGDPEVLERVGRTLARLLDDR